MSLFRRIWLTIIGLTLAAFIGSLLVNVFTARGYLEKQLFIKNQDNATALALSMSQQPDKDPVTMELLLAALFDNGHYQHIRLTDPSGKVIVERTAAADPDFGAPVWFVALLPIKVDPGVAHISDGWKQYGSISLASHSRFAYKDLWQGTLELVGWFLLGGIVAGLLGSLLLRLITRPLDQVVGQARAIVERRFVSVEEPEVPELRSVVSAMNDMVARVKQMFAEEAARLDLMRRKLDIDSASGLANRELFMSRLRDALENEDSAAHGALAIMRLNNLGAINRKLGRVETDKFIRAIGDLLNASCSGEKCLAARLNGTDFALLEQHQDNAGELGMRLANAMFNLRDERGLVIDELFYIGAIYYRRDDPLSRVLSGCDRLLAQAESKGANTVVVDAGNSGDTPAIPSETWRELISLALKEERIKLVNFPVVDLRESSLMHSEGVVRLQTEAEGPWRPAGDFMPFALRLHLTPTLDLGVVKLALQALQRDTGNLAINLSAETFSNVDFRRQFIAHISSQGNLAAGRLWVEVPEDAAVGNFDSFHELCRNLKALGCKIGIENFGRKLSAGDKLADLGVDFVKVDSSYVRGIDRNEGNREFLASLCKMVHSIGIKAIAVGVQNPQELDTLAALGFDGVTGPGVRAPG
jgi:EAL domain-containing protein (putative c-di-GMP-specific phosphodiesterase class I)/GGDEF domain-containing protein